MRKALSVVFVAGLAISAFGQTNDGGDRKAIMTGTAVALGPNTFRLTHGLMTLADGTVITADDAIVSRNGREIELRGTVHVKWPDPGISR
jgi:hypothetical protein